MPSRILVLDSDDAGRRSLDRFLTGENLPSVPIPSVHELEALLKSSEHPVLLLDLDTVTVTSSFIRGLRRHHPSLQIIALSNRAFHPELADAMRSDICACLRKPVDPEELLYWLGAICKDGFSSRDSPEQTGTD